MKAQDIFINLPIRDLDRSIAFYRALGFAFDPQFTDQNAASMIVGDGMYAMLLTQPFFERFLTKPLADPATSTGVLVAISLDSRAAVDAMLAQALAAGGSEPRPPQDHGWMYARAFEDPDGNVWEPVYMNRSAMPQG